MLKLDTVDFMKVTVRFNSLGIWDFGLGKSWMFFCFRTKEKKIIKKKLIDYLWS